MKDISNLRNIPAKPRRMASPEFVGPMCAMIFLLMARVLGNHEAGLDKPEVNRPGSAQQKVYKFDLLRQNAAVSC